MKTLQFYILTGLFMLLNITVFSQTTTHNDKVVKIDSTGSDSVKYKLIVFDSGFENFLVTQLPMSYYSESYYKTWNTQYVNEWNYRYVTLASTGLYDDYIDYDPNIDYGIKLEYKLYEFFRYFEKKHHVVLVERGNS